MAGYLTQAHTLARLRSCEYFVPDLAVRGPLAVWQANGAKVETLRGNSGAALSSERTQQLQEIINHFALWRLIHGNPNHHSANYLLF